MHIFVPKPVQSPSHSRYVSRHLSTRECLINQPNMTHAVSIPSDQNLDYEMQSVGAGSISGHNNTLYVEAASIEMSLGYEMPHSTVRHLSIQ